MGTGRLGMQRTVWVDLRRAYPVEGPAAPPRLDEQTINLTQECPGVLHSWHRSTTGEWYGLVSFAVMFGNLNLSNGLQLDGQLVPAAALRPRTYGAARRK